MSTVNEGIRRSAVELHNKLHDKTGGDITKLSNAERSLLEAVLLYLSVTRA